MIAWNGWVAMCERALTNHSFPVHGAADFFVRPHDIPRVSTSGKPISVLVVNKRQMTRWKRPQRTEITDACQLGAQRCVKAADNFRDVPGNDESCSSHQLAFPVAFGN